MRSLVSLAMAVACGVVLAGQEKPVPKDSKRLYIPGCAKGVVFTVAPRSIDEPGRSDVPAGRRFRLAGPKDVLKEIKAHEGSMVEITGLVRTSQLEPGGISVGGIRVMPASPMGANGGRDTNYGQVILDVEGWRLLDRNCPAR